ncbi:MAG: glycosyltransferase [Thermoanaerobaculia bacterium]
MRASPKVSVVVPVHRGTDLLPAALGSILRQSYSDFEVVVSGDGASESVEKAALSMGDSRVRWEGFPKAPGFGYSNRDRAIARSRGDLIAYLSPDDLWAGDHLELLVAALETAQADLVFSRPVLVWGNGRPRPGFLPFDLARGGPAPPAAWLLACVSPTQVLHSRSAYLRAGGWRDGLPIHGDIDLWLRFRELGAKIRFLRESTVVRFPSYAFRRTSEAGLAALHSNFADDLASGRLVLGKIRWRPVRRIFGWMEDFAVVALRRGSRWGGALARRSRLRQRPVDPNPPSPRSESGRSSTR